MKKVMSTVLIAITTMCVPIKRCVRSMLKIKLTRSAGHRSEDSSSRSWCRRRRYPCGCTVGFFIGRMSRLADSGSSILKDDRVRQDPSRSLFAQDMTDRLGWCVYAFDSFTSFILSKYTDISPLMTSRVRPTFQQYCSLTMGIELKWCQLSAEWKAQQFLGR